MSGVFMNRVSVKKASVLVSLLTSAVAFSTLTFAATADRISGPIQSGSAVALSKSHHPKARPEFDQGPVDPAFRLPYMTLMTTPSPAQQEALNQLIADQQNPHAASFRKWLTPSQYAERFGLSDNDLSRILSWLKSQGFVIQSVGGGHNTIIFSGTATQVQNAFQTEVHQYEVNGETHFANSTPIMIPAALNGIVTGIRGTHNFHARPSNIRHTAPAYTLDYQGYDYYYIAPGDVSTIYDIPSSMDGTGQTLGIIGETDIYLADINDFRSGFGLSQISGCTLNTNQVITACDATNFQYVLVGTDTTGLPNSIQDDLAEADLDLEWSGATAPNAQIVFFNAPDPSGNGVYDSLTAAINPSSGPVLAKVLSMSYGNCEAESESLESTLAQAASEGITVMNSSGDTGAAACDGAPPNNTTPYTPAELGLSVNYPASSSYVTAVGGTAIPASEFTSSYWGSANGTSGASALSSLIGTEITWNDDEALAQYCVENPSQSFCDPSGVKITSAQLFQEYYWISIGSGGASNCFSETVEGVCTAGLPQPSWQSGLSVSGAPTGVRYVPDVSLMASPNFPGFIFCTELSELGDSGSGGSCAGGISSALNLSPYISVIGGTSVSSPVFAGIVTLLNQYLGTSGLGPINQQLYSLAKNSPSAFHRVTSGDNRVYCEPNTPSEQPTSMQCPAAGVFGYYATSYDSATGYNLVTGLGSVDVNNLATAWAASLTNFTLSAGTLSPASVSAGNSTTSTITLTPVNNFSGSVTFTCPTVPSGVSCSFSPATVSSSGGSSATTQLTISTQPTAAAATTSITVQGASGAVTGTTTVSLTVTGTTQTFALTSNITGGTATVIQGQTATVDLTVTSSTGFVNSSTKSTSAAVTYTCAGLPTEATCTFTPGSTTSATAVTLNIATTAPTTKLERPLDRGSKVFFAILMPGLLGIAFTFSARKRSVAAMRVVALLALLGASSFWMASCGGNSSSNNTSNAGTPPGSYTITVNAVASGASSITASPALTFTLTVSGS